MKTSTTQFEMLVNFMEQHGDITKLSREPHGRIRTLQEWEELKVLLNSDPTGESKPTEKWKKVWSDLKNNTKKKAAKINRAANGTGGGPALQTRLSDLEERILNIIGPQAATGLRGVVEAGFVQEPHDSNRTATLPPTPRLEGFEVEEVDDSPSILNIPIVVEENVNVIESEDVWNQPGSSHQLNTPRPAPLGLQTAPPPPAPYTLPRVRSPLLVEESAAPPPPPPPPPPQALPARGHPAAAPGPARRGRMQRRRRHSATSQTRRTYRPQSHVEQAAQHFLDSDAEWRNLRERELMTQQRWQDIAANFIDSFNRLVDHLCRN